MMIRFLVQFPKWRSH